MKFIPGSGSSPYWCSPNGAKPMLAVCAMSNSGTDTNAGLSKFDLFMADLEPATELLSQIIKKYGASDDVLTISIRNGKACACIFVDELY